MTVPETSPKPKPAEKTPSADASQMEKGDAPKSTSGDSKKKPSTLCTAETPPLYPTPQYVFNIFSPNEITTSENNIAQQNLIKSRWKSFAYDTALTAGNPKKIRVKLSSLIVKMLNRLIKEKMLPKEAIYILVGQSHIFVQVLCSASALPLLMQRCERIGVGNV